VITEENKNVVISTWTFAVPVGILWEVWTNPVYLQNWWGPHGYTNTFDQYNFAPDGKWIFTMHSSSGVD
jgi:uncharacterized protein YndB with AHSA1/START domain